MYYVYVLWSQSLRKRYTGSTDDLEKRLQQHNAGLSLFTKRGIPWILIHSENCSTRAEAERRERQLKSGQGRQWLDERFPRFSRRNGG